MKSSVVLSLLFFFSATAIAKFNCEFVFENSLSVSQFAVTVTRNQQQVTYARTNRGIFELTNEHYGSTILNLKRFKNKIVMDAGCGGGKFVNELTNQGVQAFGVDLHLTEKQLTQPNLFLQKDLRDTGLPSGSVDFIFSTWSVLTYEGGNYKSATLVTEVLSELNRILAPGGHMYISPVPTGRLGNSLIYSYLTKLGLQVNFSAPGSYQQVTFGFLEIYKPLRSK
jgi:SAM-dependent methyltransferase